MVKLTKIYTRGGDGGESGFVDGTRRAKSDPRFAAIGEVDEANAAIGLAVAELAPDAPARTLLQGVQNDLFDLGADLATPGEVEGALRLDARAVDKLEMEIDQLTETLGPLENFVLPGGGEASARLHLARTVVRRAERAVVALGQAEEVRPAVLAYVNRLSDLLFQLARAQNVDGPGEVPWRPGGAD